MQRAARRDRLAGDRGLCLYRWPADLLNAGVAAGARARTSRRGGDAAITEGPAVERQRIEAPPCGTRRADLTGACVRVPVATLGVGPTARRVLVDSAEIAGKNRADRAAAGGRASAAGAEEDQGDGNDPLHDDRPNGTADELRLPSSKRCGPGRGRLIPTVFPQARRSLLGRRCGGVQVRLQPPKPHHPGNALVLSPMSGVRVCRSPAPSLVGKEHRCVSSPSPECSSRSSATTWPPPRGRYRRTPRSSLPYGVGTFAAPVHEVPNLGSATPHARGRLMARASASPGILTPPCRVLPCENPSARLDDSDACPARLMVGGGLLRPVPTTRALRKNSNCSALATSSMAPNGRSEKRLLLRIGHAMSVL